MNMKEVNGKMLINNFNGIKLEFDGLYYGGNYDIEIFPDGRFYYSYIENTSIELKKGSFKINQKEIMIFEEMMDGKKKYDLVKK